MKGNLGHEKETGVKIFALGLSDFKGDSLVYMKSLALIHPGAVKALLAPQSSSPFGLKAMEEEITNRS